MSLVFKPYRLINTTELTTLEQRFSTILMDWNQQYALFPLSCHLSCHPEPLDIQPLLISTKNPKALLDQLNLTLIKQCLFGDIADCFNATSERLFFELVNSLLDTESSEIDTKEPSLDEWFYRGSPALALRLSSLNQHQTIYLHPQWVLNTLPVKEVEQKPMAPLDHALDSQVSLCHVELYPVSLPLDAIVRLQVGDVITTDHLLSTPLLLKNNTEAICHVDIGENSPFKSIQIASSL